MRVEKDLPLLWGGSLRITEFRVDTVGFGGPPDEDDVSVLDFSDPEIHKETNNHMKWKKRKKYMKKMNLSFKYN